MNESFRRIAVSGSAAVALLGGVATLTAVNAEPASAAEIQAVVDRATGTPVTMPGGRTLHIRGLDNAAYRAGADHYTAAVTLASAKTDTGGTGDGITNGLTPDNSGSGSALQNPYSNQQQVPAGYGQQIQTQAGGATIGVGIVAILILGIVVFVKVKNSGLKAGDAVLATLFGIALSGTVIGGMGSDLTTSVVGSVGNMLAGLG